MADDVDRAQEHEQKMRDAAIAAVRARIAASFAPRDPRVDEECIDCAEPIEPERLRVLQSTSRCAACAHAFEQRMRGSARP